MELNNEELLLPQCRVFVDGRQIKASEEMIESVSVQLSASQMSNSCEVVIFCDHDHGRSTIGNIISRASAGKKIRVEMGYRLTKPVFLGYINAAGVSFSEDGVTLMLSCLDARGLLMGNTSRESFENKSVSQIVKELLEPVRGYTDGITVSVPGAADKEYPIVSHDMDDYQFVCMLAKLSGCTFYMSGTKLKFVKDIYSTATVQQRYSWGKNMLSFERTVELSGQLGKVRVYGTVPETLEDFCAEASPLGVSGKSGAGLCPPIRSKVLEKVSKTVKSQSEARTYAESLMREACLKLCTGTATVPGNEALLPGTKIKFGGLDPKLNDTYYITGITHTFSAGGFLTRIDFCSPTD